MSHDLGFTQAKGFDAEASVFNPDQLLTRNVDLAITRRVTFAPLTEVLKRGTLVGRVTATSKWQESLAASSDGSEVPRAIVVRDLPIDTEDQSGLVYVRGDFNSRAMTFGAGHTADSVREALQELGIAIETAVQSEGR